MKNKQKRFARDRYRKQQFLSKKKLSNLAKPTAVDRISDLPDDILRHILYFLPTRFAVATSVLSKRWISLYDSLPIINFDDEYVEYIIDCIYFCHSVDAVTLSKHGNHTPIKKFHLKFSHFGDWPFNVHEWIEAAKERGVEDIFLSLNITLVTSSGCPILEELLTIDVRKIRVETSLSNLVRAKICPTEIPVKAVYNVEFLRIIKMEKIDYNRHNPFFSDFPVFCNLIHLEILFWAYDHEWSSVARVLQHSPNLQILLIRKRSSNYYTCRTDWKNPNLVPECVSSHLKSCTIINYEGWKGDIQFLRYILKNARFLQVMRVKVRRIASYRKNRILEELSSLPRISEGCNFLLGLVE